jgi:dTDP-4-amino-4,6-dideoxygalactose transaminase
MKPHTRSEYLPYCLPMISQEEIEEVIDSLRSGWITTGPKVKRFEEAFAVYVGAKHAVALSSCTAALHLALTVIGVGPGDEVIVPTLTFCSTGNVVVHLGAKPVLVDVNERMQICLEAVRRVISPRTRAIIPVHYAGQACDLDEIIELAGSYGIPVLEDAAHAAGSDYKGRKIGTHGLAAAFSFYATKNMTTGEGGMLTTNNDAIASKARLLALHGMSRDAWKRYAQAGSWYYEICEAGYKYNMTDLQAAIGIHQLRQLDAFNARRYECAQRYSAAFQDLPFILPSERPDRNHTYHLYAIQLQQNALSIDRAHFIKELAERNIGASVHFIPLHRHPLYQNRYGYSSADFPVAESIYRGLISLPLYPKMSDEDTDDVIHAVREISIRHCVLAKV